MLETKIIIRSNCFIESVKHKIKNPKGKIGFGFKKENGHLFFFYLSDSGKCYRFARVLKRHSNKNPVYFFGYVYDESTVKKRELPTKRYIIF